MKILKWLSLLLLIILGLSFLALSQSHYLLTKNLVEKISHKFIPDLKLDFKNIKFNVIDTSLFEKKILISSKDSCHSYGRDEICVEDFQLEVDFFISLEPSYIIKKILLKDKSVKIYPKQKAEKDKDRELISIYDEIKNIRAIRKQISSIHFQDFFIELDNITFVENSSLDIKINLSNNDLKLQLKEGEISFRADLVIVGTKVSGPLLFNDGSLDLESRLSLDLKEEVELSTSNTIKFNSIENLESLSFTSHFVLNSENLKLNINDIHFNGDTRVSKLKIKECSGVVEYLTNNLDFNIRCSGIYSASEIKSLNVKKSILSLNIDLTIKETILLKKEEFKLGSLSLKGESTKSQFLSLNFSSVNDLYLDVGSFVFEPLSLNWDLRVKSFQRLVGALKGTKFSIPAPLNSLKGGVHFKSSKLITLDKDINNVPFELVVSLDKDPNNQIALDAKGLFKYSKLSTKKSELDMKVNVEKLHLYIPDIDPIKGLPPLVSEERINKDLSPSKEVKEQNLKYSIDIETKNNESIKIHYFMFRPFLALGVKANINNSNMSYKISATKEIDIVYLKRELKLLSFNLEDTSKKRINAELLHKRGGYDIYLTVIGTPSEPRMLMSSNPSLSQSDITSVLLYGRTASNLSSAEKESVGGTEAAIVDRAFGLLSIWAFASTPIESVSYNPASKTYSAQIALPGDINFELGTNWEKVNSLSFRKRLSDTWSIITTYKPGDEESLGDVLLQKEFKFE